MVVPDGDAGPADNSAEGAGETADVEGPADVVDDGADAEASCRWSGEYVRAADGTCRFARDGVVIEPVVEECCRYRLCNYACGPCYTFDECRARYGDLGSLPLNWCECSTLGPPDPAVDSRTCQFFPQFNAYRFVVWVEGSAEPARSELEEIGARHCAHVGLLGPHAVVPGVETVFFDFIDDTAHRYFPGPCPWQVAAEAAEVVTVREVHIEYVLPDSRFDECCDWNPDCWPAPM